MNPSNNLEVIEYVGAHLLRQGKRSTANFSVFGGPSCAYRGKGGMSCAVGCLIPDDDYEKTWRRWEGKGVLDEGPNGWLSARGYNTGILRRLQSTHDMLYDGETEKDVENNKKYIEKSLKEIASHFKIDGFEFERVRQQALLPPQAPPTCAD